MIGALVFSLVVSLVLTLVFETAFFFLVGKRNKRDYALLVLVNVLTNPLVVLSSWLIELYTQLYLPVAIALLEVIAVGVEGAYYKKYGQSFKHPFWFSLAANAFSFLLGLLIQQFI